MSGWFPFPDGARAARIRLDQLSMFTVEAGDGPPVVMLHGLGWDSSLWYPTLAQLAPRYRAIAADTRGHGESDKPEGPYSIDGFAADWAALLDRMNVTRATVIGLSQGGMIAQALAVRRPDLVSSLVLVATACKSSPAAREHMEQRIAALADIGPEAAARVAAEGIFSPAWRAANPAALQRFLHWRCMAASAPLTAAMRAVYGFDLSAELPSLRIPTLVVSGSADTLIKPGTTAEIAALIPGAVLRSIEGAGHIIPVEAPDAFAATLHDFLRR